MEVLEFEQIDVASFDVDMERRTIKGLVVPWNKLGRHSNGQKWRFKRGSLVFGNIKYVRFNNDHDQSQELGRAVAVEDTDEGLVLTFRVKRTPAGDRALATAQSKAKTGLSIEIELDTADVEKSADEPGVAIVNMAHLTGVGYVRDPAFEDSRLIAVRASQSSIGEPVMPENTTEQTPATVPAAAPATPPTAAPAAPATPPAVEPTPAAPAVVTFSAEQFSQLMAGIGQAPTAQAAGAVTETAVATTGRPVVDPTANAEKFSAGPAEVSEPLPYRFSLHSDRYVFSGDTEYDFSRDVFGMANAMMSGLAAPEGAQKRVAALVRAAFDVDTTDVAGLMPKTQRPDMWLPQRDYPTPLWDMVNAGTTDGTPFELPKYDSSSGLVTAAVEGVEPAPGAFTVTTQTITPTALWGKVEITRHAIRRGGNPQTSGVIWEQMLRSYFEAREAAVATFLATLASATAITLPVATGTYDNTEDQAAVAAFEAALADLQFVRGGNTFTAMAAHQYLYRLFARVKDGNGRPLYPQLNPQNANGTTVSGYKYIDVAGTRMVGAYALGAATGTDPVNSWLFDPALVRGWASQPDRLEWDFGATVQSSTRIPQLSMVTLGIFGDIAFGNLDINGVRKVVFDPQGS